MIPLFLLPLIVWGIIQTIKVLIDLIVLKTIHRDALWSAWWFPSVHSGIAASITTLMFFIYGIDSSQFAITFTFSFLFWYDAANIRYEAGQHATFLNDIGKELRDLTSIVSNWYMSPETLHQLKERLWHTFSEVIGGIIIGAVLTWLLVQHVPNLFIF